MDRIETFIDRQTRFCEFLYGLRDRRLKEWYYDIKNIPITLVSKEGIPYNINVPIINISYLLYDEHIVFAGRPFPRVLRNAYARSQKMSSEDFVNEFKNNNFRSFYEAISYSSWSSMLTSLAFRDLKLPLLLSSDYPHYAEIRLDHSDGIWKKCPIVSSEKNRYYWPSLKKDQKYIDYGSFHKGYSNLTYSILFLVSEFYNLNTIKETIQFILQKTNDENKIPNAQKRLEFERNWDSTERSNDLGDFWNYYAYPRSEGIPIIPKKPCPDWDCVLSPFTPTGNIPLMCFLDVARKLSQDDWDTIRADKEKASYFYKKMEQQSRTDDAIQKKRDEEEAERKRVLLNDFNYVNRHHRDTSLIFNTENHSYKYNGIDLLPVTEFVSSFFPEFNKEKKAKELSDKTGRSVSSILREWKEATDAGTLLHQNIDLFYHKKSINSSRQDWELFLQFVEYNKLNPYRTEWSIFDEESELAGTIDFLDYSNGRYTLYDWKRSKNLVDEDGAIKHNRFASHMGFYPISEIEDLPFWHYSLQQNLYRYILNKKYGIEVKRMKLVVLHPSLNQPVVLDVPNMSDAIDKMIRTRI